jgi:Ca2+-binding RTX toxin-like protein
MTRLRSAVSAAVLLVVLAATAAAAIAAGPSGGACGDPEPGVRCAAGNNRQTAGGGDKVSHAGWPAVSGILWKVLDSTGRGATGGPLNDELLGHHGSDVIAGGPGDDIIWGDWDPANNTTAQRDVLRGGAGDDWIYPSHGTTTVDAGPGDDRIWAFYGRGTIDCGPGNDTARIRENGAFKTRNCEHIRHFCQFGSRKDGSCLKPGEPRAAVERRARGARP